MLGPLPGKETQRQEHEKMLTLVCKLKSKQQRLGEHGDDWQCQSWQECTSMEAAYMPIRGRTRYLHTTKPWPLKGEAEPHA